ncbi:hypothetical protein QF026_008086 [Streptomyces aurantiacus]|nr:hypothetical protein [Streptomyces aurantiacus]
MIGKEDQRRRTVRQVGQVSRMTTVGETLFLALKVGAPSCHVKVSHRKTA